MKPFCVVCHANSTEGAFNRKIVGICNETNQPVCSTHAFWCKREGHGTRPLPEDLIDLIERNTPIPDPTHPLLEDPETTIDEIIETEYGKVWW